MISASSGLSVQAAGPWTGVFSQVRQVKLIEFPVLQPLRLGGGRGMIQPSELCVSEH